MQWHASGTCRFPVSLPGLTYGRPSDIGKLQCVQYYNVSGRRYFRVSGVHDFPRCRYGMGQLQCASSVAHVRQIFPALCSGGLRACCERKDAVPLSMNTSFHPIFLQGIAPVVTYRLGIEISIQGHMHA